MNWAKKIKNKPLTFIKPKINEETITIKVCPAIILALNRIAKLKARIIYENISIKIKIGNNIKGQEGINIFKYAILCLNKPIINIDKHKLNDNHKINIIWLVKAIPKGIKLSKLQIKIKLNNKKIKGKKE